MANRMSTNEYTLRFPETYTTDHEIWRAKGYVIVVIEVAQRVTTRYSLTFYDPVRLAQDIESELGETSPLFFEPNLVVVSDVERSEIERAVEALARRDFSGLVPE